MPAPWLFSFVHCADLHLDSPFEGLQAVEPEIAARLRQATFEALDRVVDLALTHRAYFLIVAGDVYDGADRSLKAQLNFRNALGRAAAAGLTCYLAHGNHDPLSGWEARLSLPPEVHRFGGEQVERLVFRRHGENLAQIYGISYPVKEVRDNLAPGFQRQDPRPFAIGVLHCNLGANPEHDNYAPCRLEDLLACRLDYWALGHIHAHRIVRLQDPCIVYPGNTQGRNWRELGERGCYLVRVDEESQAHPEFFPTDTVRWFQQEVDITDLTTFDDLLDALVQTREDSRKEAGGHGAILRLRLAGRGELHHTLKRERALADLEVHLREGEPEREDFVWVESVQHSTRPPVDVAQRRLMQDFLGDFLNAAESLKAAADPAATLQNMLRQRPEYRIIAQHLEHLHPSDWLEILEVAETLGLDLLLPEES